MSKLALLGGRPVMERFDLPEELFLWPILGQEDEDAVLDVLRRRRISGNEITQEFEKEFAAWNGRRHAVCAANGTMAIEAAYFAAGLKAGDEVICPTKTYWASCTSAAELGASVVFANVDRNTMCLDPADLERCIGPRTKAVMVVHYCGHPADMDPICEIVKKHGLKLIEDVSHAQGGRYKGRMLGTFGDVAAMSLMSLKSFSCGELGIYVTDSREIYERGLAYAHYNRNNDQWVRETEELLPYHHLPLGGIKGRANQICTAIGRIRLRDYDERIAEIRKAMNYFLDLMEGTPGFHPIRVDESTGSNMAGWYCPQAMYAAEELGGLPLNRYLEAVEAETGFHGEGGANFPLHTHPYFQTFDLYRTGKPTRILFTDRDVRELDKALAPSENIPCFSIPWFVKYLPEEIERYANGYKKVSAHWRDLVGEEGAADAGGHWYAPVK